MDASCLPIDRVRMETSQLLTIHTETSLDNITILQYRALRKDYKYSMDFWVTSYPFRIILLTIPHLSSGRYRREHTVFCGVSRTIFPFPRDPSWHQDNCIVHTDTSYISPQIILALISNAYLTPSLFFQQSTNICQSFAIDTKITIAQSACTTEFKWSIIRWWRLDD